VSTADRLRIERDEARELASMMTDPATAAQLMEFAELMDQAARELDACK
jgi:hypothetical protein